VRSIKPSRSRSAYWLNSAALAEASMSAVASQAVWETDRGPRAMARAAARPLNVMKTSMRNFIRER